MTLLHQIILNSFLCYGVFYATRYEFVSEEITEARRKVREFCKVNFNGSHLPLWVKNNPYPKKRVLWFVKKYGDLYLPIWLRNPLYDCVFCMASAWSIASALLFGIQEWYYIFPMILATCGLSFILNRLFPYDEN